MPDAEMQPVIALYERWVKAGPPPLGTLMARWWDARLVELHDAIRPSLDGPVRTTPDNSATSSNSGPTVAECRRDDLRWPLESEGE
jgi:hypothetical protein